MSRYCFKWNRVHCPHALPHLTRQDRPSSCQHRLLQFFKSLWTPRLTRLFGEAAPFAQGRFVRQVLLAWKAMVQMDFFPASSFMIFFHVFTILYYFGLPTSVFLRSQAHYWALLCMGTSEKAPKNKICRRASSEKRPRTRSCHESERFSLGPFRSNVPYGKSFFRSSSRAVGDFNQRQPENWMSS